MTFTESRGIEIKSAYLLFQKEINKRLKSHCCFLNEGYREIHSERSSMIPAMTSSPPIAATRTISESCNMLSVSMVLVTTRRFRIKTANPTSNRKPPRPIFRRCSRVKRDISFSRSNNMCRAKNNVVALRPYFLKVYFFCIR